MLLRSYLSYKTRISNSYNISRKCECVSHFIQGNQCLKKRITFIYIYNHEFLFIFQFFLIFLLFVFLENSSELTFLCTIVHINDKWHLCTCSVTQIGAILILLIVFATFIKLRHSKRFFLSARILKTAQCVTTKNQFTKYMHY